MRLSHASSPATADPPDEFVVPWQGKWISRRTRLGAPGRGLPCRWTRQRLGRSVSPTGSPLCATFRLLVDGHTETMFHNRRGMRGALTRRVGDFTCIDASSLALIGAPPQVRAGRGHQPINAAHRLQNLPTWAAWRAR